MADSDSDRRVQIILSAVPAILGIVAGYVSFAVTTGATDTVGVLVLGGFVATSIGIGRVATSKDFSPRDIFFVGFLTFFTWFVTWAAFLSV